ncbi:MAG: hypothetical protein ACI9OJ_002023 [Myxococcota bacterium]|jgi:hypothetical protein
MDNNVPGGATPISHGTAQKLIARYLRVGKSWNAQKDSQMRSHLRGCPDCAATYDRVVSLHRSLVGADPLMPTAFERGRMMKATLQTTSIRPIPTPGPRWLAWGSLATVAAVAAILFVMRPPVAQLTGGGGDADEDYIGARGGGFYDLTVGIGLSGVTKREREYEIVAEDTEGYLDDWMRITTTRLVDNYPYVFIFGLQDGRAPVWYYPDPGHEEGASRPVPSGASVPIGPAGDAFEFKLSERHVDGGLMVVAIFSNEVIALDTVKEALDGRRDPFTAAPVTAFPGLGFASDTIIRILDVTLVPGSREDSDER